MSNSSSSVQNWAEKRLLKYYVRIHKIKEVNLESTVINFNNKSKINLDGYSEEYGYAIEIYAHIGKPIAAQQKKLATDILKLSLLDVPNKILIVHEAVYNWLMGNSWIAFAARKHNIEIFKGYFTAKMIRLISKAQKEQDIRY